jgi:hypothetical protein
MRRGREQRSRRVDARLLARAPRLCDSIVLVPLPADGDRQLPEKGLTFGAVPGFFGRSEANLELVQPHTAADHAKDEAVVGLDEVEQFVAISNDELFHQNHLAGMADTVVSLAGGGSITISGSPPAVFPPGV